MTQHPSAKNHLRTGLLTAAIIHFLLPNIVYSEIVVEPLQKKCTFIPPVPVSEKEIAHICANYMEYPKPNAKIYTKKEVDDLVSPIAKSLETQIHEGEKLKSSTSTTENELRALITNSISSLNDQLLEQDAISRISEEVLSNVQTSLEAHLGDMRAKMRIEIEEELRNDPEFIQLVADAVTQKTQENQRLDR